MHRHLLLDPALDLDLPSAKLATQKENAEDFVRGKDLGLDSRSKADPRKSGWQRWYEVDFYCGIAA